MADQVTTFTTTGTEAVSAKVKGMVANVKVLDRSLKKVGNGINTMSRMGGGGTLATSLVGQQLAFSVAEKLTNFFAKYNWKEFIRPINKIKRGINSFADWQYHLIGRNTVKLHEKIIDFFIKAHKANLKMTKINISKFLKFAGNLTTFFGKSTVMVGILGARYFKSVAKKTSSLLVGVARFAPVIALVTAVTAALTGAIAATDVRTKGALDWVKSYSADYVKTVTKIAQEVESVGADTIHLIKNMVDAATADKFELAKSADLRVYKEQVTRKISLLNSPTEVREKMNNYISYVPYMYPGADESRFRKEIAEKINNLNEKRNQDTEDIMYEQKRRNRK
jgi:hypothetical protein